MSGHDDARCRGKQRLDRETAQAIAKRANRRQDTRLNAFRCSTCGGWHVGSHTAPRACRSKRPVVDSPSDVDDITLRGCHA